MERTTTRRLPDGTTTTDEDKYVDAWRSLGEQVVQRFPGYIVTAYDPDIVFEFHEIGDISNTYKVSDRFHLSPRAINALLHGIVPPKLFRTDF